MAVPKLKLLAAKIYVARQRAEELVLSSVTNDLRVAWLAVQKKITRKSIVKPTRRMRDGR